MVAARRLEYFTEEGDTRILSKETLHEAVSFAAPFERKPDLTTGILGILLVCERTGAAAAKSKVAGGVDDVLWKESRQQTLAEVHRHFVCDGCEALLRDSFSPSSTEARSLSEGVQFRAPIVLSCSASVSSQAHYRPAIQEPQTREL